ncbi:cyclic lactone autoinducer peptide [Anaerocolumna sp. AGMB13025]|uniref:cyclic lactone autoinducer peptide n=1 Tax=Anaerocolumna sp. AGMB13025 TaxID=3039116 RepID=UPI003FA4644F
MSIKNKVLTSVMKIVSIEAKSIAKLNVNSVCAGPLHQPKVPECANKLRKVI